MSSWKDIQGQVQDALKGAAALFFRGQPNSAWTLSPGLARLRDNSIEREHNLYFDFATQAGALLPAGMSSWATLLTMQHHGLPTRLLDWSETFSVALYFAIKSAEEEAVVWILDPYRLNEHFSGRRELLNFEDLPHEYVDCFLYSKTMLKGKVLAVSPLRQNPRVSHQRAGFTLHIDLSKPLEELHPGLLRRIVIPKNAFDDARAFLRMAGINEFSLFPDLDGLARELKIFYGI